MRKAEKAVLGARPFAKHLFEIMRKLIKQEEVWQNYIPSLAKSSASPEAPVCFLVVASDRGLAGSFNNVILRFTMAEVENVKQQGKQVEVAAVGRKARDFFSARGVKVAAEFFRYSDAVTIYDAAPVADWLLQEFEKGRFEKVMVSYTEFVSALVSRPALFQLLPFKTSELAKIAQRIILKKAAAPEPEKEISYLDYVLEPSRKELLEELSRYLVKVAVTRFLFESNTAEHSSRMITMKNATDNAGRIKEELTLELNKARQSAITQEVSEVSSSKEALTYE